MNISSAPWWQLQLFRYLGQNEAKDEVFQQSVLQKLDGIQQGQTKLMAQIDDLKVAVTRIGASTSAEIKAVSDKLSQVATTDPAITDAIASLNKTADALDAETTAIVGTPAAI